MPHNYPKPDFEKYYKNTVRPLVMKYCEEGFRALKAADARGGEPTAEEQKIFDKYFDIHGCWYVGLMIQDIDTAMIHGQGLNMLNGLNQVCGTLKEGSSYGTGVWKNDFSSDEAKALLEIGKEVEKLIQYL